MLRVCSFITIGAGPCYRLEQLLALDPYPSFVFVVFIVFGHVLELNRLLGKIFHLILDRILFTSPNEGDRVVDTQHGPALAMIARVETAHSEIIIEKVVTMAAVLDSVIDQKR